MCRGRSRELVRPGRQVNRLAKRLSWQKWELGAGRNYLWGLVTVVIFMGRWGGKRWSGGGRQVTKEEGICYRGVDPSKYHTGKQKIIQLEK